MILGSQKLSPHFSYIIINSFDNQKQYLESMDSQNTLQQYIISLQNELSDIESLDPTQMVTKLQQVTNSGL